MHIKVNFLLWELYLNKLVSFKNFRHVAWSRSKFLVDVQMPEDHPCEHYISISFFFLTQPPIAGIIGKQHHVWLHVTFIFSYEQTSNHWVYAHVLILEVKKTDPKFKIHGNLIYNGKMSMTSPIHHSVLMFSFTSHSPKLLCHALSFISTWKDTFHLNSNCHLLSVNW